MISLFLDTSSKKLVVILVKDKEIIGKKELESINDHSSYLVPFIKELLDLNNIKTNDINKIFVVNGPGSFTGTRIGVTVGKVLAFSNNIPVIPVSSLKQYIFSLENYDYYVSIIKDKNNRMYYGIYDKDYNDIVVDKYQTKDVFLKDINDLKNVVFISEEEIDGIDTIKPILNINKLIDYYKDKEINAHYLKPNYLKKIDAEDKL
ncbi:MAG: tRNA (adenosine(37)-N6)-threonylcarbamoyltransferase complex dimerization subunit type 1 TsaB [Bacilli bacterium]|nr:tRNA (adenosine(37)-N6)-threonylcarbamoyltransferase complex dimerization subunit type 1 TsaB [Bacilli bacterium]